MSPALPQPLAEHLAGEVTTLCRCWGVARRDGLRLGFTDHDRPLAFEGFTFTAASGLTPAAVEQSTGLSIDTATALGALSDEGITEADLAAGRYDGAEVTVWLVNWADPAMRAVIFKGRLGEVRRGPAAFEAELVGLAEALNRPVGRVFQRHCDARLGDGRCGVDLQAPGYHADTQVIAHDGLGRLIVPPLPDFDAGWFAHGVAILEPASADPVMRRIAAERSVSEGRQIELAEDFVQTLAPGTAIRLVAGCDKRAETCRNKFNNLLNFQGFPHLPGEAWMAGVPAQSARRDGSSMNR